MREIATLGICGREHILAGGLHAFVQRHLGPQLPQQRHRPNRGAVLWGIPRAGLAPPTLRGHMLKHVSDGAPRMRFHCGLVQLHRAVAVGVDIPHGHVARPRVRRVQQPILGCVNQFLESGHRAFLLSIFRGWDFPVIPL